MVTITTRPPLTRDRQGHSLRMTSLKSMVMGRTTSHHTAVSSTRTGTPQATPAQPPGPRGQLVQVGHHHNTMMTVEVEALTREITHCQG